MEKMIPKSVSEAVGEEVHVKTDFNCLQKISKLFSSLKQRIKILKHCHSHKIYSKGDRQLDSGH